MARGGNPNPSPATRFKPGNPGGPGAGRGPRKLSKILEQQAEQFLKTPDGKQMSKAEAICMMAYKLALEGDLNAIKFLFERIEGKVPEKVEVSGNEGSPLAIEYVNDWRGKGTEAEDLPAVPAPGPEDGPGPGETV